MTGGVATTVLQHRDGTLVLAVGNTLKFLIPETTVEQAPVVEKTEDKKEAPPPKAVEPEPEVKKVETLEAVKKEPEVKKPELVKPEAQPNLLNLPVLFLKSQL